MKRYDSLGLESFLFLRYRIPEIPPAGKKMLIREDLQIKYDEGRGSANTMRLFFSLLYLFLKGYNHICNWTLKEILVFLIITPVWMWSLFLSSPINHNKTITRRASEACLWDQWVQEEFIQGPVAPWMSIWVCQCCFKIDFNLSFESINNIWRSAYQILLLW